MLVVGGGVVGLWTAFRAAERGASVVVLDPSPGQGASWTAAGMLSPITEYAYGEDALLRLNLVAAQHFPSAVADVQAASGLDAGYERSGALEVAWDAADLDGLRDLDAARTRLGLQTRLLGGRELRQVEPGLAPGLPGGVLAADEAQVDNRKLVAALLAGLDRLGVVVVRARVVELLVASGRVTGVLTNIAGSLVAGAVVLAAGAATSRLPGLPEHLRVPVRPVKGQTIRVRAQEPVVSQVVRGRVRGVPVYVVPRSGGEIVIGASSEEAGFDALPRTGVVHDLLRDAVLLVPGLAETEFVEVSTGLRPGTPDNGPVVGRTDIEGLILATGHYRNGILLSPLTGAAVAGVLAGDAVSDVLVPFGPDRFASAAGGSA